MQDSSMYPLESLYQIGWMFVYITTPCLIYYCGTKLCSTIERYRMNRRNKPSELVKDMSGMGRDSELVKSKKIQWD